MVNAGRVGVKRWIQVAIAKSRPTERVLKLVDGAARAGGVRSPALVRSFDAARAARSAEHQARRRPRVRRSPQETRVAAVASEDCTGKPLSLEKRAPSRKVECYPKGSLAGFVSPHLARDERPCVRHHQVSRHGAPPCPSEPHAGGLRRCQARRELRSYGQL